MSKIIIRGQFPFLPGKAEQAKTAVRILRERTLREDKGVLTYEFFTDEANKMIAVTEVYADEAALVNHLAASDFTALFSNVDMGKGTLQVHGNLSAEMLKTLGGVGPYQLFVPV